MEDSSASRSHSGVTVGELIRQLQGCPADAPVCFGPSPCFHFYRVKSRGTVIQIEFNEVLGEDYTWHPVDRG